MSQIGSFDFPQGSRGDFFFYTLKKNSSYSRRDFCKRLPFSPMALVKIFGAHEVDLQNTTRNDTHPTYENIAKDRVSKDVSATTTERRPRQAAFPRRRAIAETSRSPKSRGPVEDRQPGKVGEKFEVVSFRLHFFSIFTFSLLILVVCYHSKHGYLRQKTHRVGLWFSH